MIYQDSPTWHHMWTLIYVSLSSKVLVSTPFEILCKNSLRVLQSCSNNLTMTHLHFTITYCIKQHPDLANKFLLLSSL